MIRHSHTGLFQTPAEPGSRSPGGHQPLLCIVHCVWAFVSSLLRAVSMAAHLPPIQSASLLLHPAPCPSVARALSATPMRRGGGPLLPTVCRVSSQPGVHHVHTQRVFTEMTRNDRSGKSALLRSQCPSGKEASYTRSVPEAGRGGLLRTQVPPAPGWELPWGGVEGTPALSGSVRWGSVFSQLRLPEPSAQPGG